jgi:hypothetical protein
MGRVRGGGAAGLGSSTVDESSSLLLLLLTSSRGGSASSAGGVSGVGVGGTSVFQSRRHAAFSGRKNCALEAKSAIGAASWLS